MKNADASVFQWWNSMWQIIHFDEINSTQTYAKENKLKPYTIVTTNHQTSGLGQHGRVWEDENKSAMLTAILPLPKIPIALFTQYIALNIIEQLSVYRDDIQIKWPNDLVIGRKKLGGILTEVSNECVYIGIGINLTNPSVSTGIGLLGEIDSKQKQVVLNQIIEALKIPISKDVTQLEEKHVYCQAGVFIHQIHYPNVSITENGELNVIGYEKTPLIDSQQIDQYYQDRD